MYISLSSLFYTATDDMVGLRLANLHSQAVDYVKTGHAAQMSRDLKPPKRPHFMDNTYQKKENTYISRKVLGQLYDQVERVNFVPAFAAPFDDRILKAYEHQVDELLPSAREIKKEYDAHMRRIMAQHEIKTEFEVWSTFVLEHSKTTSDFKFHEQIGQISTALKEQFRGVCYERAGGKTFQQIGPYAAAMYKVTAIEMAEAIQECHQTRIVGGQVKPLRKMVSTDMPFMSFPWLFQDILGRIAINSEIATKGRNADDGSDGGAARNVLKSTTQARKAGGTVNLGAVSDLETAQRTTHVGDLLELFEDSHV
jgi:RNA-dependent RNA polymerase